MPTQPARPKRPQTPPSPPPGAREAIVLTDDDEAILDRIWADIARRSPPPPDPDEAEDRPA